MENIVYKYYPKNKHVITNKTYDFPKKRELCT